MKRFVPLLLALLMVVSLPLSIASAQSSITPELKKILEDPNTNKSGGLPALLESVQGKTKAKETIKSLGPQLAIGDGNHNWYPIPGPLPWPWPWGDSDDPWNNHWNNWWHGYNGAYPNLATAWKAIAKDIDKNIYPTFYFYEGRTLMRAVWSSMVNLYSIYRHDVSGEWIFDRTVGPNL